MRNTLIIIGLVIAVLIIGALVYLFTSGHPSGAGSAATSTVSGFPTASSTSDGQPSSGGQAGQQTMTVPLRGSSQTITVQDFINNGTTVADPSNAGNYYLAGATPGEYSITYDTTSQSFTISLNQEPLGQGRLDAQSFLLNALGVTPDQLCALNYFITTTSFVNPTYAGQNLGFSFCSGAIALPD